MTMIRTRGFTDLTGHLNNRGIEVNHAIDVSGERRYLRYLRWRGRRLNSSSSLVTWRPTMIL